MLNLRLVLPLFSLLVLAACSSPPTASREKISLQDAERFLKQFCSSYGESSSEHELSGDLLVRSSTKEFKGQYPASIHFSKDRKFSLEVTNLLGGTVVLLKGDEKEAEIMSPVRPQYNRKGIRQYMGLSIPILAKLIRGDLPCPNSRKPEVDGNEIRIEENGKQWRIERAEEASGGVPVRVRIFEGEQVAVEMTIERWNKEGSYAEKVSVRTSEGDLKWAWRSRELK